jgi:hypothetical protein
MVSDLGNMWKEAVVEYNEKPGKVVAVSVEILNAYTPKCYRYSQISCPVICPSY